MSSLFYLSYHSVFLSIRSLTLVFGYNECEADSTIGCTKGSSCITVNRCPRYTEGYEDGSVWRYTCILGKWEPITCVQLPPRNFKYPSSEYSFVLNQPITTIIPTIECYKCIFKIKGTSPIIPAVLPAGIHFNESDGSFSGTPTAAMEKTEYTIIGRAEEAAADAEFVLSMEVISWEGIKNLDSIHNFIIFNIVCGTWLGKTTEDHGWSIYYLFMFSNAN